MSKNAKNRTNQNFLPGFEDFDPSMIGGIDNDPSLEAELLELIGGGGNKGKKIDRPKKKDVKQIPIDNNLLNLDLNDNDNVSDVDENDPELLAELNSFLNEESVDDLPVQKNVSSPPSSEVINKLENLKQSYQEAVKQAANDPSKLRRFKRSLDTVQELLQKASRGLPVDESEFPPVPPLSIKPDIPKETTSQLPMPNLTPPEPPKKSPKLNPQMETASLQKSQDANSKVVLDALISRQEEYKHAAIAAKQKDLKLAKGLMVVYKQFGEVIQSVRNGEPFDLGDMPPHPSEFNVDELELPDEPTPAVCEPEQPKISSLGEELQTRRGFYKNSFDKAKSEGNDSKARRFGRLVQQYDEALAAYKKNQPYAYEDLPPPPGTQPLTNQTANNPAKPVLPVGAPSVSSNPSVTGLPSKQLNISKNTKILLERQAQFKSAALKAKQDGDLPLAKELLKQSKGFDQMIEAAKSGFPVNMSSLPSLPTEPDYNFELINVDECEIPREMLTVDKETLFKQLQSTLVEQIQICAKYEKLVTKAGDIMSARRFQVLARSCEKDLGGLKCLIQKRADIPKFHYEYKVFSVLQSNPDLGETEMAVDLIRGIDFATPSGFTAEQLDTYVVLELPFPNDAFQTFTSETIKRTSNPIYNFQFKFQVNIKSRVFQRVVKSKQLKADIYYKKGFLQKDKLLGSSNIKLEKLETQCTIHETFDIYENRKLIGGKLELKIRIRMPLSGNQSENVKEKWLVIDDFNQKNVDLSSGACSNIVQLKGNIDQSLLSGSIDVLKFEIGDLKKMIITMGNKMSSAQMNSVKEKIQEKELATRKQEEKLKSPDPSIRLQYLQSILKLPQDFNNEAKRFLSENNRDKAQLALTKKKLVEKEIERLKDTRNKN